MKPPNWPAKLPTKVDGTIVYLAYSKPGWTRRTPNSVLLYVGITDNLYQRMAQHATKSEWWQDAVRLELEVFETRHQAQVREKELVRTFAPPFNTQLQAFKGRTARTRRQNRKECRNAKLGCKGWAEAPWDICRYCQEDDSVYRAS